MLTAAIARKHEAGRITGHSSAPQQRCSCERGRNPAFRCKVCSSPLNRSYMAVKLPFTTAAQLCGPLQGYCSHITQFVWKFCFFCSCPSHSGRGGQAPQFTEQQRLGQALSFGLLPRNKGLKELVWFWKETYIYKQPGKCNLNVQDNKAALCHFARWRVARPGRAKKREKN